MASWTEIPNSSLESGAPVRSVDGVALRDNPVAIAEGATGAPEIKYIALEYGSTIPKLSAGTEYIYKSGSFSPPDNSPLTTYVNFDVFSDGSCYVYLNTPGDPSGGITVYVYVNDVLIYSKNFDRVENSGYVLLNLPNITNNIKIKAIGNSASNRIINYKFTTSSPCAQARLFNVIL